MRDDKLWHKSSIITPAIIPPVINSWFHFAIKMPVFACIACIACLFLEKQPLENTLEKCRSNKQTKGGPVKQTKGKLFAIDNADLLLDDKMREYIASDAKNRAKNQHIIIGRNPKTAFELQ